MIHRLMLAIASLVMIGLSTRAFAHDVPDPSRARRVAPFVGAGAQAPSGATTGSGKLTFRHYPLSIPDEVAASLVHAHGGFAVDHEKAGGDGSTYFSLKGVGVLRLSPDLSTLEVVGGDEQIIPVNHHNTTVLRHQGEAFLALPSDEAQKAFLTTTGGQVVRTFPNPYGDESDSAFRVCDVEYVDGFLFAANGYADNVVFRTDPFRGSRSIPSTGWWDEERFGGTGRKHGRFGTAHGLARVPDTKTFTVADRANSRLETFTATGRYIGGLNLPEGTMPCDVDYHRELALVSCLKGPGGSTPAPILILRHGNLVAELNPGRDLGLPGFTHIHHAAFRVRRDSEGKERLYVLVYAWNPGNFAILEQVSEE